MAEKPFIKRAGLKRNAGKRVVVYPINSEHGFNARLISFKGKFYAHGKGYPLETRIETGFGIGKYDTLGRLQIYSVDLG